MTPSRLGFWGLLLCFALAWAGPGPVVFEDIIRKTGIAFRMDNSVTPARHQIETMTGGVALLDYNNDGLLDIYFTNGAQLPGMEKSDRNFFNRLYRNNGDETFTDVTLAAGVKGEGYAMGVASADYDNDGYADLYVTGVNRNQLFHNNGDGTFTDVTNKAGVAGMLPGGVKAWSVSAGWFDYDNDGLLDLFVVNYVDWKIGGEPSCSVSGVRSYCSPDSFSGQPNILYHNNGDGTFTDVSMQSGIGKHTGKGMGVAFADYDNDGYLDIFVSNDTFRNFLFHNNRNGTFTETAVVNGVAYNENGKSIAGMGTDFRDVFNAGRPDIFVVGMVGDTFPLFRNGGRAFEDVTASSGVARFTTGITAWGAGIFDFDNDGKKDLFAAPASILDNSEEIDRSPSKLPNLMLRNLGNGHFENVSATAGADFGRPAAHRGAAFGDLNNDGKIDIVVVTQNDRPQVLLNRSSGKNHWIEFQLQGTRSNRDGIGSSIQVRPRGANAIWNHATTAGSYASSNDKRVHFGLGDAGGAESVEIRWPSGSVQKMIDVAPDQILKVREPAK